MSRRAEFRRAARAEAKKRRVPAVPGILPDRTEASIEAAMEDAHRILPPLPGTEIALAFFDPEEGLEVVRKISGDEASARIRRLLDELPPEAALPTVVLATRQYRDAHLRNRPTTTEGSSND